MQQIPISAERMAQLEAYAYRHKQSAAATLDAALAEYLTWEHRDTREAVDGIREGLENMKAGNTQSAEGMFEDLRKKHGLPG